MNTSILKDRSGALRPLIHFTSQKGWINDPNGLIYYKGKYHLFYQFNPYGTKWDKMHWGHAVSSDMLHWRDMPIALTPTENYENDQEGGCFSGSAIEKDGRLYLIYTASAHIDGKLEQTQCLAYSDDGVNFVKYEKNPVITRPSFADPDFRDPKIFKHEGKYYTVIGGNIEGDGKVFLYSSDDIFSWKYEGILFSSEHRHGWMLECPDFFPIEDKWVLTFSPMSSPDRKKCVYLIGDMDFEKCSFTPEYYDDADKGFDYYAPQSFQDENGRRVMIAWMNRWLWMPYGEDWGPTENEGWRGALTLPRTVTIRDGRLEAMPVSTIHSLYTRKKTEGITISESKPFTLKRDKSCILGISYNDEDIESGVFSIRLFENAALTFDLVSGNAIFSYTADGKGIMLAPLRKGIKHEATIIVDGSAVEIFIDDGFSTISANVFREYDSFEFSVPYKTAIIQAVTIEE